MDGTTFGPPLTVSRPPTRKSMVPASDTHSSGWVNQRDLASGSANAWNTRAGSAS